ncbi:hypothetical protein WJX74_007660 [Apatococcus lobatus]|uniref:Glycosyltransferase n=1 Tax=Apatococcus lobatus TaxID=904363 RepID=A0AAW1QZI8_9CHLO
MCPVAARLAALATVVSLTPFIAPAILQKEPSQLDSLPRLYNGLCFVDRQNYAEVASALASPRKEIILTTASFQHEGADHSTDQLDLIKNYATYLHDVSRLQNTFIVSYDQATCKALHSVGILCFMDEAAPHPDVLPGQYAQERPHWFSKYWHAHALSTLGYCVLFLDDDVVVLQDPFMFHDRSYDVEGLSDWNWLDHVPDTQEMSFTTCRVYAMYEDEDAAGGQMLIWNGLAHDKNKTSQHVNPCQSTGIWFTEPTPTTLVFLDDLLEWLLAKRNAQWDQAAWNEAIMSHLIGTGNLPGLRYRLLPIEHFSNIRMTPCPLGFSASL